MASRLLQHLLDAHYPPFAETHPLPDSRPRRGARAAQLPHGRLRGPRASLSGRPHRARMVQLVSPPVVPAVHPVADRPMAGETTGAAYSAATTITSSSPFPSELNALWLANVREVATVPLSYGVGHAERAAGDPKYLGATPGMLAALHTWGQTVVLHPHLHCLVTGGGWDGEQWRAVRNGYLLPARVVMPVFRGKLLAALHGALEAGQLTLPAGVTHRSCGCCSTAWGATKWHVQIMTRYAHGQGVATYLARYLRGGPLKPGRIVAGTADGDVRYADNQDPDAQGRGQREVLPSRWRTSCSAGCCMCRRRGSRSCGPMGCMRRASGRRWRSVGRRWDNRRGDAAGAGLAEYCAQQGPQHPERCPVCGRRLIRTATVAPVPPAAPSGPRAARCGGRDPGGGMTRRSRLAPPRFRSSFVRRGAGVRAQRDRPSAALLPARPGSRCPACAG